MVIQLLDCLPPTQAVLIRGPHGIGKSHICLGLGEMKGQPVIDRRLAQMTEGDIVGLPRQTDDIIDDKTGTIIKHGSTRFMPPDWFVRACDEPCVLFLDELNRATPEIQACVFELILDRRLQGRMLHPETRVIAAVNGSQNSNQYHVNDMDPALLDRFLTIDMIPNLEDWKEWARNSNLNPLIVEFCAANEKHWWFNPADSSMEPNKVYPTPRSWSMLNDNLSHANLYANLNSSMINYIASGLVGTEAAGSFCAFIKDTSRVITAEDILDLYDNKAVQKRVKNASTSEMQISIIERLQTHFSMNLWNEEQVARLHRFFVDIQNAEILFAFWAKVSAPQRLDLSIEERSRYQSNTRLVHKVLRADLVRMTASRPVVATNS